MIASPSALAAAQRCPLEHWRHARGEAPTEPDDAGASRVGEAVHAVLAWCARQPCGSDAPAVRERVGACALATREEVEEATRLAFAGWRRLPAPAKILGAEVPAELDLEPDGTISGRVDMLARVAPGVVEVTDWKTGHMPDRDELAASPEPLSYCAWARAAYPADEVRLRYVYLDDDASVPVRPVPSVAALRAMLRAAERNAGRKIAPRGRPGAHCGHCRWRTGCADRDAWLEAPAEIPPESSGLAALGAAYGAAAARAKVMEQARKDLGARLVALLGRRTKAEEDGVRVTKVRQERARFEPSAVRVAAAALGRDLGELWDQVGQVRTEALEALLPTLPTAIADEVVAERSVGVSEYVRVSGERA